MQSCYLAGPGTVDKVNILRDGTDGAEMKVVPENPVVVELVKERYCFVASRNVLFEDPESAGLEAERLRVADIEARRIRQKEIRQMINAMDNQGTGGDTQTQAPNLVLVGATQDDASLEVEDTQGVVEVNTDLPLDLNEGDGGSNPASPTNFLKNIQRVVGNETLSLEEVHSRLKAAKLMPAAANPIHYIKFAMVQERSLFERPTRMSVCLTAESPYLATTWNPETAPTRKKKPAKVEDQPKTKTLPLGTVKKMPVKKPVKEKPLKINPAFLSWMGNPMIQKVADKASFDGEGVRLLEQYNGSIWTCEIFLASMKLSLTGESKMRHHARHKAEANMAEAAVELNIRVHQAKHSEDA
jgi:hypothetical protein